MVYVMAALDGQYRMSCKDIAQRLGTYTTVVGGLRKCNASSAIRRKPVPKRQELSGPSRVSSKSKLHSFAC